MMMRMLAEGGAAILADDQRAADSDNPRGYFELEAVKGTARDASWVREAPGKLVKVISALLPHLPATATYRVVFMRRSLDHVVRSQRAMLDRLELAGDPHASASNMGDEASARRALAEHIVELDSWLETAHHMRVLGVSYERVLAQPEIEIERIVRFLELELDRTAMLRAIEPALRRQR